ncbi:MAG: hypothetical protein V1652_01015 [bacterium]
MAFLTEIFALQEMQAKKIRAVVECLVYSMAAFLLPFFIGHPQFIVGSFVNVFLVLSALNLKNRKILPVALLPSIAVLCRGLIFGTFTPFLFYMIPFIWLGNIALVFLIKYLYLSQKVNTSLSFGVAVIGKVIVLYSAAMIMIKLGILPEIFAMSMGMFQVYTACIGSAIAIVVQKNILLRLR